MRDDGLDFWRGCLSVVLVYAALAGLVALALCGRPLISPLIP